MLRGVIIEQRFFYERWLSFLFGGLVAVNFMVNIMIILELSHPIVWLVRHVCSDKAEFSFLQKKTAF